MKPKVIITAALTGALADRQQCPAIPYTASEIAAEGRRSLDAGASILHVHARDPEGKPAYDLKSYRQIDQQLKLQCPEAIINYSTGAIGIKREQRIAHISNLKPAMAALNMGSMNYAIFSQSQKRFLHDHIFQNSFADIQYYLEAMNAAATLPEMECFDCGHIFNHQPFKAMGLLQNKLIFSLVMGVLGGIPATAKHLQYQVESLPAGSHWQCIVIGLKQWSLLPQAISWGGGIRVGLEDNFYLAPKRMARSNGELVSQAAQLVHAAGAQVATPQQAREILGIADRAPA